MGKNMSQKKRADDGGWTPTERHRKDQLMRQFIQGDGPKGSSEAFHANYDAIDWGRPRDVAMGVLDGVISSSDIEAMMDRQQEMLRVSPEEHAKQKAEEAGAKEGETETPQFSIKEYAIGEIPTTETKIPERTPTWAGISSSFACAQAGSWAGQSSIIREYQEWLQLKRKEGGE